LPSLVEDFHKFPIIRNWANYKVPSVIDADGITVALFGRNDSDPEAFRSDQLP
jgi:hypothetical protein